MDDKFFSYISEPLNAKLLLEIYEQKHITTAMLAERFSEVPQATLYRRLQKMLADDILKIVEENHIRGTVEKVYALNYDIDANWKKMAETNDGKALLQFINYTMLGILREFSEYTARENIDIKGDGTGLFIAPVYATYDELKSTLDKIVEILTGLKDNKPDGERKLRNICITITPPRD